MPSIISETFYVYRRNLKTWLAVPANVFSPLFITVLLFVNLRTHHQPRRVRHRGLQGVLGGLNYRADGWSLAAPTGGSLC